MICVQFEGDSDGHEMSSGNTRAENEVWTDAEEADNPAMNAGAVKQILREVEDVAQRPNRQKRSRESPGSPEDSVLVSKFEEVMTMIRRENLAHREAILADMKKEFAVMTKEIETKLEAVRERLEKRVAELETHVSERDDIVEQLRDEVVASRHTIRRLENDAERQEMSTKAAELILSGGAVPPAPRPGAASAGPPGPTEDLREVTRDVIKRAFPRADIVPRDLADVRRIGARVLLCRFVHTGPGSARHYLYENRLTLKGKRGESELFISESLTARNKEILNSLLELKKSKRIYCVFTKNGSVFYKPQKVAQKVRVGDMAAVVALSRELQRNAAG